MHLRELMAVLSTHAIGLQREGADLMLLGNDETLDDALWDSLAEHKAGLLDMLALRGGNWLSPAYRITPDMLPLVQLDQAAIDRIVATVPGGVANLQDIYPLAPLQEGMLYHHLAAGQGDPYVLQAQFAFASAEHLQAFAQALQWVIDRHDILRTAIVWDRLDEPLQVVWRRATLAFETLSLATDGDVLQQLRTRHDSRQLRLDVRQAPLLRLVSAEDPANQRVVALLLFHHMVMDHTALDVVRREIQAVLAGQADQLPAAVPFRDALARVRLNNDIGAQEQFFTAMLGDIDAPTLPFGLQEADVKDIEESRLMLDAGLSRTLRAQARQAGVSVASLMHLAMARVLGVVSGREAVVFGTVLLGRMDAGAGAEQALGMFINTLPLRVDVGGQGVRDAVLATHQRLTALLGHEQASLALAQRCSAVNVPTPLFGAIFNYRHSDAVDGAQIIDVAPGIQILGAQERTNYPLTVNIDDLGEDLRITAMADTRIGAERFTHYLETALHRLSQALEQQPDSALHDLDILPAQERQHLLHGLNPAPQQFADLPLIHQQFEAHAAARPQATALIFEGQRLSYGQLNSRANQLAHHLLALGAGPDQRVAICVERGVEMIVGLLGVLKAGAGYVPIDPAYPQERIVFTLQDSAPLAVLVQGDSRERVTSAGLPIIELGDAGLASQPTSNPQVVGLGRQHLAYVIYTSGSTGLPKGVMVEHRNVTRLFSATREWFDFNQQDVWALFHSFAFDFSVWEIWGALAYGGQLLIVPQRISREPQACYALLCEAGVSVLNQTPSAFRQLIAAQQGSPFKHSLREVIFGGEALEPGMLKPWYANLSNAGTRLVNMYGITETTVHVTYRPLQAADAQLIGVSPIGRAIPDLQLYVLDEQRQPLPVGVVGELYVGGAGVARGYLNREQLSAERFINDPFSSDPQARLYRTGDLARWNAEGDLDYLGRNDDQVKIRGFRIELGEIQARLAACAGVRDAVVIARQDNPGDQRLVAYWIAAEGAAPTVAELREQLLANLADYMVPGAFVRLDALPLTTNGKLDRKALPRPDSEAFARQQFEAPQGEVEQLIAGLWQDLLQIERVGRHDNFFELGGHSLLAVKLVERMRQHELHADVRVLFGQPNVAALAAAVGDSQYAAPQVAVPANRIAADAQHITPDLLPLASLSQAQIDQVLATVPGGAANVQDIYALAPLQAGVLYHHLASAAGDPYVLQVQFAFADIERIKAFVAALNTVIARHDILRSSVVWEGLEEAVQVVWRSAPLALERIDEALLQGDVLTQLQARFDPRHYRLDLSRAPLLRLAYTRDPANRRWVGILLLHHIILDHTALETLVTEISAALAGVAQPLAPPAQYRNYVAQARLGANEQAHEAFFRAMLGDIDEPTLAYGLQDVHGDGSAIVDSHLPVDAALDTRLRQQARHLGISIASLVHQAWALVLARLSGREQVVFGTVLLGRLQGGEGADRALGMFINTLPLRIDVNAAPVLQALRSTHQSLAELLGHEQASLAQALRCSAVPAAQPLFGTLLNYRHNTTPDSGAAGWQGIDVLSSRERSNYPLVVNVDDFGSGLRLTVQALASVDGVRVCEALHAALDNLVLALEQAPHRAVHKVSVLSAAERERVVSGFNLTGRDYPREQTVHRLFELQAARQPQAVAAVHGAQQLSYRELNEQANRLAYHLLGLGVQSGHSVAVLLERSLPLLVAQLAISKCAAVYVPLDVNAPAERQAFMVQDSQAVLLLTESGQPVDYPARRLNLDEQVLHDYPAHDPHLMQSAEGVAYIMYTSGSTGTPKGVLVPHRAISRLVINNGFAEFNAQDRVAFASNPAFDASTLEVWAPLLNGGCVVVVGQDTVLSRQDFAALLEQQAISVLWLTAGLFHQYAADLLPAFSRLRYLMVGGDVLDPAVIARVLRDGAPQHLLNGYGPTEATTFTTTELITQAGPGSIPIGRPIGNTRVYVLDARQQLLPVGAVGELYVGGDGVAKGYLNQPQLTDERFIADPFSDQPQAKLYRTGDLVSWQADGTLLYLGRNDQQVKIRGFRIEPGEIEARLAALPALRDVAVLVREDAPGDKRLVAYFTVQAGAPAPLLAELHEHLHSQLPDYMVPAAYVQLDSLPLTRNGKLDRRALPAPDQQALVSRAFVPPQGDTEIALAAIWSELLKVEQVGRFDHFFELGGHSLLAVTLIERMRQIGLSCDVRALFSQPSLAALAAAVGSGREVLVPDNLIARGAEHISPEQLSLTVLDQPSIDRIVSSVPGGAANVQDIYGLAPLQEGILYHHISAERGDPYLLQSRLAFDSVERLQAFAATLQQVIDRHDILRTAVLWQDLPAAQQVVWRHAELPVQHVPLAAQDGDVLNQLQARFDARHYRLDLSQAPLLRIVYADDPVNQRVVAILLFHHLILDHTAMEVVGQEMQALMFGQAQSLSQPVPYRNYVAQARLGASEQEHELFFRELLGDIDEPTLPFGLQDVQGDGRGIEEARLPLAPALSRQLREQARQLGVSAASLMHLAWARVLGVLANRRDVVFGTVLLGRMQGGEGADRALGVFINTLPLRVDTRAALRDGVKTTHQRLTALLGHEHASLALAQRCSGVAKGSPLFSALLNYRHSAVEHQPRDGQGIWEGVQLLGGEERSNYPLTLSVDDLGEDFALTVLAASSIGAERICGYMQAAVQQLSEALRADPAQTLEQLPILPAAERQQLLDGFNATAADYPQGLTIDQRVAAQAAERPDAVAAVYQGQSLSYGQLEQRANGLAAQLLAQGVQPDERVAVVARRGLDTLVGLLAVLKAGGAYVPVDPAHPAERLAYLLSDSQPKVVLTLSELVGRLPVLSVPVIELDRLPLAQLNGELTQRATVNNLAYVIYTSGSTGLPKGVMVEHQTLNNLVDWHCEAFDLGVGKHTSSLAGFGFDAMAWEVWPALCSGATLHLAPTQDGEQDIEALLDWWRAQPLDVSFLPTPVAEYAFSQQQPHPTLKTLLIGGDRLRQFLRDPGFAVVNNYGPTEATVVATSGVMQVGELLHIGKPMANAKAYVLDEQQQPVPIGVVGELYVGGAGVARGYLNREDLTAERFLTDPFNGGRMYRTGDLVRWLADGNLEYLGRNDDQVKIRGVRVELGEIEAALSSHAAVKDAVALVRGGQLVVWFSATQPVDLQALRDYLQGRLADYLIPAAWVQLDSLPLTVNGKLDRKALPDPDQEALLSREYQAPQGETETALAAIWAEVLKVPRVGRFDHFFELGGHSLLAVTLVERMRQAGLASDVRVLFNQPTLAALAAAVGNSREVAVPANLITLDTQRITPDLLPLVQLDQSAIDHIVASVPGGVANVQDIYPLAPLQEGILYHHISARQGDPYLLQSCLAFDSHERLLAFADALRAVIARHDILRTAVLWQGLPTPVQVVWRQAPLPLLEVQLDLAAGDVLTQLQARFDARDYRLDISQAPLVQLVLANDPANQRVVAILLFHHLALDHTALEVVRQEMQVSLLGLDASLGQAIPYRNYVVQARHGVSEQEHEGFFRDMLGDIDEPTLPFGLRDVQGDGADIEQFQLELATSLASRLRSQAQQAGVSAASLFHLAWARVLGATSGKDSVVFGTVLLGRLQGGAGADRGLGMFINTLPLRVDLDGAGVRDALKSTHARLSALLVHEHAPLALAQRCSGVAAPLPLFSAMLNFRHSENHASQQQALQGIVTLKHEGRTNYPLTLNADDLGDGFRLTVLTPASIGAERLCGYMQQALSELVEALEQQPRRPVNTLPVLDNEERQQLLEGFNATAVPYDLEQTLHGLFSAQVQRTPNATALQAGEQVLSYAQLEARADALAQVLIEQGVQPDARVAICVERSVEMVVGLLGILKAGGAYVPLDPAYPLERLQHMLEDSKPVVLLVHQATRNLLPVSGIPVINLETIVAGAPVGASLLANASASNLAYVIYTSGSTGKPKGVMNEHAAVVNRLLWMQ
ncbi:amino acid adenylation domain-containing protein, partial [Pseudomonas sp. 21LCFQ02]|uniref:non-ribosomal peptide synthetase n=1 Tax=Pseudomonas sp. 21LCFQ02 TaxID=2957505 RepID=UPI00209AD5E4